MEIIRAISRAATNIRQVIVNIVQRYARAIRDFSISLKPVALLIKVGALVLAFALFGWSFFVPLKEEQDISLVTYRQEGSWDYRVYLLPNSLIDTTEEGPSDQFFARLIDSMVVRYHYHFQSNPIASNAQFVYNAHLVFGSTDLWQKEFAAIPDTQTSLNDFTIDIAVPVREMIAYYETIRKETNAELGSPVITLTVNVFPQVNSTFGVINQPFTQTFNISYEGEILKPISGLSASTIGDLTETTSVDNANLPYLRLATCLFLLFTLYMLVNTIYAYRFIQTHRPEWEKDLQKAEHRLHGLLVRTNNVPPPLPGQQAIHLQTMDSIVTLALESNQPIIYMNVNGKSIRCILPVSDALRYEFNTNGVHPSEMSKERNIPFGARGGHE